MIEAFIESKNDTFYSQLRSIDLPMEESNVKVRNDPLGFYDQLLAFEKFEITKVLINSSKIMVG